MPLHLQQNQSMLEQVRNLVVIKISVTISVALFILILIIFTCVKIVAHPRLMPHCGIIWVHITSDFRRENNSTPGVLIEEIWYVYISYCGITNTYLCCISHLQNQWIGWMHLHQNHIHSLCFQREFFTHRILFLLTFKFTEWGIK